MPGALSPQQNEHQVLRETTTQAFVPTSPLPKKKSRLRVVVLVGVLVVVLAASALAATYFFERSTFERIVGLFNKKQSSDDISRQVFQSLFSVTTADVETNLVAEGPMFGVKSGTTYTSKISGSFDPKGGENGSFALSYDLDESQSPQLAPTAFSIINVGSDTYIQAEGLPSIFIISDAINNKWLDISDSLKKSSLTLPKANKSDVLAASIEHNPFTIDEKVGTEKLNGVSVGHYKISVDPTKEAELGVALSEVFHANISREEVQQIVASTSLKDVEVWVGTNDFFPYKWHFVLQVTKNESAHLQDGSLDATVTFSKLNEKKDIAAPKNAIILPDALRPSIQGFVGGLFDKAMSSIFQQFPKVSGLPDSDGDGVNDASEAVLGTNPNKKDSNGNGVSDKDELSATLGDQRDADSDGLADGVETLFGTDPNNKDSDGDGFEDGPEVLNGFNPKGAGKLFPENSQ